MGGRFPWLAVLAASVLLSACPKKPGPDALDEAQAAIEGAAESERCAGAEFRAARALLEQARTAWEEEDYERAQQLALAATEQAHEAEAIALANREDCDRLEGLTEELESTRTEEEDADLTQLFGSHEWTPVLFDFDQAGITDEARAILAVHARYLTDHPELRIRVEGHCDEKGSTEYNLALGERRARVVVEYLVQLGVSSDRLRAVSYGEEMPTGDDSENRRAEFRPQ